MLNVGIAFSRQEDLIKAVKEAGQKVKTKVKKPKLLIFVCTYTYHSQKYQEALSQLKKDFPHSPLVGGSVYSIYTQDDFCNVLINKNQKAVALFGLDSEYLNIGVGLGKRVDQDAKEAGRKAVVQALDNLEYNPAVAFLAMVKRGIKDLINLRPISGFLLTPGDTNKHYMLEDEILEGAWEASRGFIRLGGGGMAGGPPRFVKTAEKRGTVWQPSYQFFEDKVFKEAVLAIVFGSDLEIGYGLATGFKPVGPGAFVTKGENWTIHQLNGRPAGEVLGEILEEVTKEAKVKINKEEFLEDPIFKPQSLGYGWGHPEVAIDFYWPNPPLSILKNNAIEVDEKIRVGSSLALLKTTKDDIIGAEQEALMMLTEDAGTEDIGLIFYFTSPYRDFFLRKEASQVLGRMREAFQGESEIFGFGTYGTIGSLKGRPSAAAGQTMALMAISNTLITERRY
jgi:hypothetical protein